MNERTQTCKVCETDFPTRLIAQKYCCPRCRYIALYLNRPQALLMGREAAIEHYGQLFDDPLRPIGKSRYMPQLRHIYGYCVAHHRATFTEMEINEEFIGKIDHYVLRAIYRRHGVVHICPEKRSLKPTVWQFTLPQCEEIMRLQI